MKNNNEIMEVDLVQSNEILNLFGNMQLINNDSIISRVADIGFPKGENLKNNEMCFYRIKQLSFDEDYPHREALENILTSLDNDAFNFVYILTGTEEGIDLCVGVVKNKNENKLVLGKKLAANDYGKIIESAFEGNFSGSRLEKLVGQDLIDTVVTGSNKYKNAGAIIGVPSINEKEGNEDCDFQGIDRLINSMLGLNWRLVVVCEPVDKLKILEIREDVYEIYNKLAICSKKTMQASVNDGQTISFSKNISDSKGKNFGYNKGTSKSKGRQSETTNSSESSNEGTSEGTSIDHSEATNRGVSTNKGTSRSVTIEIANKYALDMMKYIDEELLERLKLGFGKGLFKTSVYYMAEEPTHANRLKVGIVSLFQGNNSTYSPLYVWKIDLEKYNNMKMLRCYQNQFIDDMNCSSDALMLLGRPFENGLVGINTYLTSKEVSLLAGLPQKEVPGVSLKESVGFGLNEKHIDDNLAITLGAMVQKGRVLNKIPFKISRNSLAKHTFIAGVTGSGKTTTCHKLLSEAKLPFLVIEPAKTEYRTLINSKLHKDVVVFTLGNETVAPFRINPFELIPGEVISAHVDMVKATFTSAFPMEASMPQILEEAIYNCYKSKGWNVDTNENELYGDAAFDEGEDSFPIMSDLLVEMESVVESKHFSAQMQADYIGSLVSRLSNLTVGSKGQMLNCQRSTDFRYIVHNNVILEMEELKSAEDKALFMGFVLSRMSAIIKDEHSRNHNFKHITLIEEAHRLLSKVEYGDSGSKKTAVETFTDLLAEVRKYGEGIIVVDQIPNKLASEVLKNTNTKIIHKILARDDKEAVGDTMLMDDKQKEFLSALPTGNAIVFSEDTDKPVHIAVNRISDTSEEQISNDFVKERFNKVLPLLGGGYKDINIMLHYSAFNEVCRLLSNYEIDSKKFGLLKTKVSSLAKQYNVDTMYVWEKLVSRRDVLSGKSWKSSENKEERINSLISFFKDRFEEENFSEKQFDKKIAIYLK